MGVRDLVPDARPSGKVISAIIAWRTTEGPQEGSWSHNGRVSAPPKLGLLRNRGDQLADQRSI
jgi:hypothetical protein